MHAAPPRNGKFGPAFVAALLATPAMVPAAVLVHIDGTKIEATILNETPVDVKADTRLGVMTFRKTELARIERDTPPPAATPGAQATPVFLVPLPSAQPTLPDMPQPSAAVAAPAAVTATTPSAAAVSAPPAPPPPVPSGGLAELDDFTFRARVAPGAGYTIVSFGATWCGPCRKLHPVLEKLAGEFAGKATLATLDVDKSPNAARQTGLKALPTLVFYKGDREIARTVGAPPEPAVRKLISDNMAKP